MESYAQALLYAIPVFLLLIGLEALLAWKKGMKINTGPDMISSLSSGISNVVKDVLGLSIAIISYAWLVDKVALFDISSAWYVYVIAFIAKDFAGYWIHRLEHSVNVFWNRHIIHHSSEEFNLSCALRQSISEVFSFVGLFLLPAALIGVPAQVIAVIAPVQLFAQFWYHTRLIDKMGLLEHILVTPSHHRVHHAINPEYLDRNYSQIFIIWDKLFGTYQPELKEVPPVYGVKRPVHTWNPLLIGVQHVWLLIRDTWRTRSWKDKFRIWFMPTGWRPADVMEKYPVVVVSDVYHFEKYNTRLSPLLLGWSWLQLGLLLGFTMLLFYHFASIGFPMVLAYGLFIFISIFSLSATMDKTRYAVHAEMVRTVLGFWILYDQGGSWFGAGQHIAAMVFIIGAYLVVSPGMVMYFAVSGQLRSDNRPAEIRPSGL